MDAFKNLQEFFEAHEGEVFRYWVYRRMYTPYEQSKCFSDESFFESIEAQEGFLRELIPLGNGDYLLGFQPVASYDEVDTATFDFIDYVRLSEIRLGFSLVSNRRDEWEDDEAEEDDEGEL